jgi:hypothetical protein
MVDNNNVLFYCNEEIEAFMVLAFDLQKNINTLLFSNQKSLSGQSEKARFNFERKSFLQTLMNSDEKDLNSIKFSIVSS